MGKQGPCSHCGIATTPLCPNGPPDKEVLCNACGSRWRTKGTLPNHTPMHSGGSEGWASPEVSALGHGNSCSSEYRSSKRKEPSGGHLQLGPIRKFAGNDSTSASSLSSYISDSDEDANGLSSPVRSDTADSSPPWEGRVPCRKRSSMPRACTSVDKLIRQFQDLVYEDSPVRSSLTSESEKGDIDQETWQGETEGVLISTVLNNSQVRWYSRSKQRHRQLLIFDRGATAENLSEPEILDTGSSNDYRSTAVFVMDTVACFLLNERVEWS